MHVAFLTVDGKKMSKSLGNFYNIQDIIDKSFDPLSLRYLYLGAHYKKPMNFTWESLKSAETGLNNLRDMVRSLKSSNDRTILSEEKEVKIVDFRNRFNEAVNDDLNIPKGLAVLWEVAKSNIPSSDKYDLAVSFDEVLGLGLTKIQKIKESKIPSNIKDLIKKREQLRQEKKFEEADRLRVQIEDLGFKVEDKLIK